MEKRRRMTPHERRSQLLDIGDGLFDEDGFEELSMDQIAARAGVTRALLYHYFPTKAHFFAAVWSRTQERLNPVRTLAEAETVHAWLVSALAGYLDFYAAHPRAALIATRSSIAGNALLRDPIADTFEAMGQAVLDAAACTGENRPRAAAAFRGWIALVREITASTLVDGALSTEENLALCVSVLDASVGRYVDLRQPPLAKPPPER